jgi:hypothetical protein
MREGDLRRAARAYLGGVRAAPARRPRPLGDQVQWHEPGTWIWAALLINAIVTGGYQLLATAGGTAQGAARDHPLATRRHSPVGRVVPPAVAERLAARRWLEPILDCFTPLGAQAPRSSGTDSDQNDRDNSGGVPAAEGVFVRRRPAATGADRQDDLLAHALKLADSRFLHAMSGVSGGCVASQAAAQSWSGYHQPCAGSCQRGRSAIAPLSWRRSPTGRRRWNCLGVSSTRRLKLRRK